MVRGSALEFLVGGGGDPARAGVRLLDAGRPVRQANGRNDDVLRPARWEIGERRGHPVVIPVVFD